MMTQVAIFRTNVSSMHAAQKIAAYLSSLYEGAHITFDLEDVDRILRIAPGGEVDFRLVKGVVSTFGFQADELPDEIGADLNASTSER